MTVTAPSIASTNSMRLPSRSATRSPLCKPIFRNPVAICADCCATSRHVIRLMPQTKASPSGFLDAASDTIAQMLLGRSQNVGTTRSPKRASSCMAGIEYCDQSMSRPRLLAFRLHAIDMFRAGESARAHVPGIAPDRGLDHRAEIAVAADEFRRPRRQPEHILQHEHLAIAGGTGADADGRNGDGFRDLPGQRFRPRLDHHRKCADLGDRIGVVLDRLPVILLAALGAKRAE